MENSYNERKLINHIRSTIVDGNLCDADKMTRFTSKKIERVYYLIQARNKAVSLLISSPIKDDHLVERESEQVITVLKLFRGRSFLVQGVKAIRVTMTNYKNELAKVLREELKGVFDIDLTTGWVEYSSLKDETQQKIHKTIMYGERVLTEKQLREISNKNIAIPEHELGDGGRSQFH